jgi:hypothetical protein
MESSHTLKTNMAPFCLPFPSANNHLAKKKLSWLHLRVILSETEDLPGFLCFPGVPTLFPGQKTPENSRLRAAGGSTCGPQVSCEMCQGGTSLEMNSAWSRPLRASYFCSRYILKMAELGRIKDQYQNGPTGFS